MELKNQKHEKFAKHYAAGSNGSQAYLASHGEVKGPAQSANRLLKRPEVIERIAGLREEATERSGFSQDSLLNDLEDVFRTGMENPERGGLSAAQNAKFQQAKILGLASGKEGKKVEEMSDAELVAAIRDASGDRLAKLFDLALRQSMGRDISADLDRLEGSA